MEIEGLETKVLSVGGLWPRKDHRTGDYWHIYHSADNRGNYAPYTPVSCAPSGFVCDPFQFDAFICRWQREQRSNPPENGEDKPADEQPPMDRHTVPANVPALLPAEFLVLVFQRLVPFGRRR